MIDEKQLLQMWNAGKTMTEIGNEFGVTRSAISGLIGRARQRGILFRRRTTAAPRKLYQRPAVKSVPVELNEVQGPRRPVSFLAHTDKMCKSVVTYKDKTAYCSWPHLPGKPYCALCDIGKSYPATAPRPPSTYIGDIRRR